ncbi:MAG: hypothetical protein Q8Q49_00385 [bacterium]|nr:hypothetical protein [bacterium]
MKTNTPEFKVWKTIQAYRFELDLVLVSAEDLEVSSSGESGHQPPLKTFEAVDIAHKALESGLTLPPIFASDQLKLQIPPSDNMMICFIINEYGEVMTSSWFEGQWQSCAPTCALSCLTCLARYVFVKPRKQ